ncbi:MAG TPA: polysaccharide pyruvyl transferase family protein [Caulobacteraceae bacterium]
MQGAEPHGLSALRPAFDRLAEALRLHTAGRRVVFLQNPGNFGDALIRCGTLRFFEDLGFFKDRGLDYREFDMGYRGEKLRSLWVAGADAARRRHVFIYAGSGAWAADCDVGRVNVKRISWLTSDLVVLPTTFETFDLTSFKAAFRRDEYQSRRAAPETAFCHDMAFYLALIDPERVLPGRTAPVREVGYMFRTDVERRVAGYSTRPDNLDLSALDDHRGDPRRFLAEIDKYERIVTDRLHVAIGALVLGKPVTIVTGSYFKIEAIYRSSIAGVFPNVRLVTDDDELSDLMSGGVGRLSPQPA